MSDKITYHHRSALSSHQSSISLRKDPKGSATRTQPLFQLLEFQPLL